jgi:hypothetical protein
MRPPGTAVFFLERSVVHRGAACCSHSHKGWNDIAGLVKGTFVENGFETMTRALSVIG